MKKEEKTRRTYERIMTAAMEEFGTKSYDAASLTTLCSENQISKGLIYHNFKNKDELYLKCVEECFEKMTLCFKNSDCQGKSVQERIHDLFSARQHFFEGNPYYANLFFRRSFSRPDIWKKRSVPCAENMTSFMRNASGLCFSRWS